MNLLLAVCSYALLATLQQAGEGQPGPARQLAWLWLALGGAVLLFVVVLSVARSWYLRSQREKEVERELLAEFQEAVERGEMSPEEFARVRRLLVGRLAGEPVLTAQSTQAKDTEPRDQDLPILEQETYTPPAAKSTDQPQGSENKTDNGSSSPESSATG